VRLAPVCPNRHAGSLFGFRGLRVSDVAEQTLKARAMNGRNGCSIKKDQPPEEAIIFSLHEGYVLASWPGTDASVRLGRHETVAAMMKDFLAQDALGRRLVHSR
jgi:hypothetical protein